MTATKPNPIKPDVATLDSLLVSINGQQYRVDWNGADSLTFWRTTDSLCLHGYIVSPRSGHCTCADYRHRGDWSHPCKHLRASRKLRLLEAFAASAGRNVDSIE